MWNHVVHSKVCRCQSSPQRLLSRAHLPFQCPNAGAYWLHHGGGVPGGRNKEPRLGRGMSVMNCADLRARMLTHVWSIHLSRAMLQPVVEQLVGKFSWLAWFLHQHRMALSHPNLPHLRATKWPPTDVLLAVDTDSPGRCSNKPLQPLYPQCPHPQP